MIYQVVLKDGNQFIGKRGLVERWNEPLFGLHEYKVVKVLLGAGCPLKNGDRVRIPISSIDMIINNKGGK
jgi:hypothetical protein